ncbi:MAG: potassium channel family protein [Bacteroidia bacterium]
MLTSKVARRFLSSVGLLVFTLVFGIVGFRVIEGYSWLDSAYMTVITMSTVGFEVLGDEGFSPGGKLFVIFLIIFTLGLFTYTVSTITSFMVEGEVRNLFRGYRLYKEISKTKNHIVICGLGRNGRQAAIELMAEKVPFVAIESNSDVISNFLEDFPDSLVLKGDATEEDTLLHANIIHAKGAICALADDAANVFVTS